MLDRAGAADAAVGGAGALVAACAAARAAVDDAASKAGVDPVALRTRVGTLLTPPGAVPDRDLDAVLFATAVVAAAGPCHPDAAARIVAACAPAGLQGRGTMDPQVVRKAVASGHLMRWTLPVAAGGGPVLEAHPDVDAPGLRPGLREVVALLAGLDKATLHRVSDAATRSLNYATSLLLDPARAVARVGEVPGISW